MNKGNSLYSFSVHILMLVEGYFCKKLSRFFEKVTNLVNTLFRNASQCMTQKKWQRLYERYLYLEFVPV